MDKKSLGCRNRGYNQQVFFANDDDLNGNDTGYLPNHQPTSDSLVRNCKDSNSILEWLFNKWFTSVNGIFYNHSW